MGQTLSEPVVDKVRQGNILAPTNMPHHVVVSGSISNATGPFALQSAKGETPS